MRGTDRRTDTASSMITFLFLRLENSSKKKKKEIGPGQPPIVTFRHKYPPPPPISPTHPTPQVLLPQIASVLISRWRSVDSASAVPCNGVIQTKWRGAHCCGHPPVLSRVMVLSKQSGAGHIAVDMQAGGAACTAIRAARAHWGPSPPAGSGQVGRWAGGQVASFSLPPVSRCPTHRQRFTRCVTSR